MDYLDFEKEIEELENKIQETKDIGNKTKSNVSELIKVLNQKITQKKREIYQRYCNTDRAKLLIGYESKINLEEGIRKIIDVGILPPKWATSEKEYTIDDYM